MEISRMLTVSTAHISEETNCWLSDCDSFSFPVPIVVYPKEEYGWFIHKIKVRSVNLMDIPKDLAALVRMADALECDWLCLDRDGELVDNLPIYKW